MAIGINCVFACVCRLAVMALSEVVDSLFIHSWSEGEDERVKVESNALLS